MRITASVLVGLSVTWFGGSLFAQADRAVDPGERELRRTEVFPADPSIPPSVELVKNVVYGSPGGRDLRLDVVTRREKPAEAEIYPGKPHAWFNKDPDWKITVQRVEPFVVKHFGLKIP